VPKKGKKVSASEMRSVLKALMKEKGWNPSGIINLLRGGGTSTKGSAYERDMCKKLSMWWTHGQRDDIYWRSAGSGARAKVRGRAGRDTAGQHGDIAATDPIGAVLIDLLTIEIKRGYSENTMHDLFDRCATAGPQTYEDFITQTIESHEQAGSYSWLLITRRDRREALAWVPAHLVKDLRGAGAWYEQVKPDPYISLLVTVRNKVDNAWRIRTIEVVGMHLQDFLLGVDRQCVEKLAKETR